MNFHPLTDLCAYPQCGFRSFVEKYVHSTFVVVHSGSESSTAMPRLTLESRRRVLVLHSQGYSIQSIWDCLQEERVFASSRSLYNSINKYKKYKTYFDLPRRAIARKLTADMLETVDQKLHENDELQATQRKVILRSTFPNSSSLQSRGHRKNLDGLAPDCTIAN